MKEKAQQHHLQSEGHEPFQVALGHGCLAAGSGMQNSVLVTLCCGLSTPKNRLFYPKASHFASLACTLVRFFWGEAEITAHIAVMTFGDVAPIRCAHRA